MSTFGLDISDIFASSSELKMVNLISDIYVYILRSSLQVFRIVRNRGVLAPHSTPDGLAPAAAANGRRQAERARDAVVIWLSDDDVERETGESPAPFH